MKDFKRARNDSQKELRKKEIIEETIRVFENEGFDKITFSKISKNLNIQRPLLYTYYKNKSDIFIDYIYVKLEEHYRIVNEECEEGIPFVESFLSNIEKDYTYVKIISIFSTIIEPSATLESLIDFKSKYYPLQEKYLLILRNLYPTKDEATIMQVYSDIGIILLGLLNVIIVSDNQIDAMKEIGITYKKESLTYNGKEIIYRLHPFLKE